MSITRRIVAVAAAGLAAAVAAPAQARDLTLWYDEPAASWETQSLPIGNGALGAAVFGGVDSERVQFNEKTLWTGGPGSVQGYTFGNWEQPRPGAIEEVQRTLDEQVEMEPPAGGIDACATRELRIAANQNGTERLTGEVDRMAIFARALSEADVPRWQSLAFG